MLYVKCFIFVCAKYFHLFASFLQCMYVNGREIQGQRFAQKHLIILQTMQIAHRTVCLDMIFVLHMLVFCVLYNLTIVHAFVCNSPRL